MSSPFVPGLELAGAFYAGVVRPLLEQAEIPLPATAYAAALIGPGSEVLGYDSIRSTDHDWGPRLQVFLSLPLPPDETARTAAAINELLGRRLPAHFRGYRTTFPRSGEPAGPARHGVEVAGLVSWLTSHLGFDPQAAITVTDWLAMPAQRLAEITAGAVFHDGPGDLSAARDRLAWYPHDVWLHVLACQWQRIAQEEAFPGRCAEAGDELGSAVVTARLVRDIMRLFLLMHRRYPPYSKWLGTAFATLPEAVALMPVLTAAITAPRWPARQRQLCRALEAVATMHNELGLTPAIDPRTRQFFGRPYLVLGAGRFTAALRAAIGAPWLRRLPLTGAADQYIDSTDALGNGALTRAAAWEAVRQVTPAAPPG